MGHQNCKWFGEKTIFRVWRPIIEHGTSPCEWFGEDKVFRVWLSFSTDVSALNHVSGSWLKTGQPFSWNLLKEANCISEILRKVTVCITIWVCSDRWTSDQSWCKRNLKRRSLSNWSLINFWKTLFGIPNEFFWKDTWRFSFTFLWVWDVFYTC